MFSTSVSVSALHNVCHMSQMLLLGDRAQVHVITKLSSFRKLHAAVLVIRDKLTLEEVSCGSAPEDCHTVPTVTRRWGSQINPKGGGVPRLGYLPPYLSVDCRRTSFSSAKLRCFFLSCMLHNRSQITPFSVELTLSDVMSSCCVCVLHYWLRLTAR